MLLDVKKKSYTVFLKMQGFFVEIFSNSGTFVSKNNAFRKIWPKWKWLQLIARFPPVVP